MADERSKAGDRGGEKRKKADQSRRSHKVRGLGKIRKVELCPFTMRLAAMLDAGLPLIQCMEALSEQTQNLEFQKVIKTVSARIEAGDSFAEALGTYEVVFGELYVSMIGSGEMSGALAEVTQRLGSYLEASMGLRRRVKSAMTYPVIVMGLAGVLTIGMLVFIVPTFASIYEDFDAELPKATKFLMFLSDLLKKRLPIVAVVCVFIWWALKRFRSTEQGALLFDRYVLKAPVAGALIEKVALARMSRTFASMIRSGVPILRTVEIVGSATGNKFLEASLIRSGTEIEGGLGLAESLKKCGDWPPMLIHMVSAGEKTGNVDGMLEKVADFYDDEVSASLESLSSMIEPLLMAFLGIVIGGIVVCMFMPIFKMHEIVS